jgi:hypothetical protein
MRRNQLDVKRSRLWVARLKGRLSVVHPIAGDELRAIKHYLATREDNLPWLFVSERQAQLTRSPARPSIISCGLLARPQSSGASGRTGSATRGATISPIRAPICGSWTTSATAIPSIPPITPGLPGTVSKVCGSNWPPFTHPTKRASATWLNQEYLVALGLTTDVGS